MKLIIGLGNPGPAYAKTRHNVGFNCIELLTRRHGLSSTKVMFKARLNPGTIDGVKVVLARPLTFMNLSGQAVGPLVRWYHIPLSSLLVIHDDLDLMPGRIRLRERGGAAGHKGMLSIIAALGTECFPRLRIGIGRPTRGEPEDYVLSDFSLDESIVMQDAYDRAIQAVEVFVREGVSAAMNRFNAAIDGTDRDADD